MLSSRRVTKSYFEIHQKVLLICSKILKNCNLNKKLYRSTYFLPQKLKFMIIFCRQHLTHYYCQHILIPRFKPHILCEIWPPWYLEDLVDWIIYFEPTVIRTHHGTPSLRPPSLYLSKYKNLMFWWPAKVQGASHWINFKKCYIFSKKKQKKHFDARLATPYFCEF